MKRPVLACCELVTLFCKHGHCLLRDTGTSTVYLMFTQNTRPLQDTVMLEKLIFMQKLIRLDIDWVSVVNNC